MTTGIFNAGFPLASRSPGALLFQPNTWADNAFYCKFAQLDADRLGISAFNQTGVTPIPVVLFMHDAPCMLFAQSRYEGGIVITDAPTGETYTIPQLHFGEQIQQVGDVDAVPITTVLAAASITPADAEQGERINGNTFTNAVPVTGFAYEIPLADQSLVDALDADVQPSIALLAVAQSGVMYGPNSTGEPVAYDGTGVAHADATAVILRESDYTQAMRDAGNVYTDAGGVVIRIMGLHAIPAEPQ